MKIPVMTSSGGYDIILERGALKAASNYLNLNRKVLIVTDSGVPARYSQTVAEQCNKPFIVTVNEGEQSKCFERFKELLSVMVKNGFTRSDCVVAVGGGVVGDLAGFVAASYMRGVDFYNIPTTILSQVDSSIGGKVAIDFEGYKNIVGAFYPPDAVIADPETLRTLPGRQLSNGLAEALKMSLTSDKELFSIFENGDIMKSIDTVIERSLRIKKYVVEKDEHESGIRKILNFGHTLAHAIESESGMNGLYHGECVAIGMLPMCSDEVRERVIGVLSRIGLPTAFVGDTERIIEAMKHDKKLSGNMITVTYVKKIGEYEMREIPFDELALQIRRALDK